MVKYTYKRNVWCVTVRPGSEKNEHTNKAAPETPEKLQPAVWTTERARSWISQLRMIDLRIGTTVSRNKLAKKKTKKTRQPK
jgi:hypothetical protein